MTQPTTTLVLPKGALPTIRRLLNEAWWNLHHPANVEAARDALDHALRLLGADRS